MKKIQFYLAVSTTLLCIAACSKNEINPGPEPSPVQDSEKVTKTFSAGVEATKTTILSNMDVAWLDTDQIAVFDGTTKNNFAISQNSGTTASFTGEVTKGATDFYAAYPASLATALDNGVISVSVPSEQIIPEGKSIGDGALVAVAHYASETFAFKNVPGVFKFTIDADNVTSVTISTMGGEPLSGAVKVTVENMSTVVENGVSYVTVKPASGAFAKGDYYAAVIPGEYKGGLSTVMTRSTDNLGGVNQSTASASVVRNDGINLGAVKAIEWGTFIRTASELKAWSKSGDFSKAAILGADIEVGDWAGCYRESAFNGKFYGLGHKLYNITYTPTSGAAAMLYQPKSEVSNLYVGTKDGVNYDGVSKFTLASSSNGYAALFTYTGSSTVLRNVVNFATFEATTAKGGDSYVRIAGIVAAPNGGTITGCKNYGKIICSSVNKGETNVGGLFGFFDTVNAVTITNCENHGEIICNCQTASYIGGMSGRTSGSTPLVATGCKNYGKITVNASAASPYVAGLFPWTGNTVSLKACENHGTINVENAPSETLYLAGIIGGVMNTTSAVIESCYNKCPITYTKNAAAYICGIVANTAGKSDQAIQLKKSKNEAAITATGTGSHFISGICGYARYIIITECENNAKLSVDNAASASSGLNIIGGIIAYSNDGLRFNNNINNGAISINTNTSNRRVAAGGILGDMYWVKHAEKNYNYGTIIAKNINATTTATVAAGGILGGDYSTTSDVINNWIEKSYNYGDITAEAASKLGYAGGIAGLCNHIGFYRVWNYGNITGTDNTITGSAFGLANYLYAYASVGGSVNGTALTADNWESYFMGSDSTATYVDGKGGFVTK